MRGFVVGVAGGFAIAKLLAVAKRIEGRFSRSWGLASASRNGNATFSRLGAVRGWPEMTGGVPRCQDMIGVRVVCAIGKLLTTSAHVKLPDGLH